MMACGGAHPDIDFNDICLKLLTKLAAKLINFLIPMINIISYFYCSLALDPGPPRNATAPVAHRLMPIRVPYNWGLWKVKT